MPIRNLRAIGRCAPGTHAVAVSEHAVVLRPSPFQPPLRIVPIASLREDGDAMQEASFSLEQPYQVISFLDQNTLCLLNEATTTLFRPPSSCEQEAPHMTWIRSSDPEFRTARIVRKTIYSLRGFHILHARKRIPANSDAVEIVLWVARYQNPETNYRTLLTITTTHSSCSEPILSPYRDDLYADVKIPREQGRFVYVNDIYGSTLYHDTRPEVIFCSKHPGITNGFFDNRWLVMKTDSTVSIYDAREKSQTPSWQLDISEPDQHWPSLAVSKRGRGIFINQGIIYEFTATITVPSLETYCAIETWKQLTPEKIAEIKALEPYTFDAFVRSCYET